MFFRDVFTIKQELNEGHRVNGPVAQVLALVPLLKCSMFFKIVQLKGLLQNEKGYALSDKIQGPIKKTQTLELFSEINCPILSRTLFLWKLPKQN